MGRKSSKSSKSSKAKWERHVFTWCINLRTGKVEPMPSIQPKGARWKVDASASVERPK